MIRSILIAAFALLAGAPAAAQGGIIGSDAAACAANQGPAIQANIVGLKDRTGELKLELYPDNQADFLKDDRDLLAQGKLFRRVRVPTPAAGAIAMCIRVPRPGRYALLFVHNRDGRNKFSFWSDGAGLPGSNRLGRTRPTLAEAEVNVGEGVAVTTIRAQYLRGFGGFGPVGK